MDGALKRRCAVMLELSASLARVLEWMTRALPGLFLGSPAGQGLCSSSQGLNLARLAEVAAFVVAHLAGASSAASSAAADGGRFGRQSAHAAADAAVPLPPIARALAKHFLPSQNMRRSTLIAPVVGESLCKGASICSCCLPGLARTCLLRHGLHG